MLDPILLQTMFCVICHFVCQSYSVGSTTSKRRKGMTFYSLQHGITSMKKYILGEHLVAWCKWENVNVVFDSEKLHRESPKRNLSLVMGPS